MLAELGCDTVVDCSTNEIGRDPAKLAELSRRTGTKIVMGCGNYTGDTHSEEFRSGDEGRLAEKLISEIDSGIGGVRPGDVWACNMFKGGGSDHYACWRPIARELNFHQPKFFGRLVFA